MEYPLNVTLGARMSAYLSSSEDYHKQRKRLNKRLLKLRHELDLITPDTKDYKKKEKYPKSHLQITTKTKNTGYFYF